MRIATFYENRLGRNDGPPLYWLIALRALGHDVVHLSSENKPDKWGKFDLYLWVDWGEDGLTGLLPYTPIKMNDYHPSVYVTSDTHLGFDYRLEKAREFDHVFCNQKRAVEEFAAKGVQADWLPHAVNTMAYPAEPTCIKKYDVGFVGYVTFEKRADALDRIFKEFPNFYYGQALFEDCAEIYRQCRVVLNTAADDDINMRMFEVCATGSAMVCEWVPTLEELEGYSPTAYPFKMYKNLDEAVEAIKCILNNGVSWDLGIVAKNWALQYHTYEHRAQTMLDKVKKEVSVGISA